MKNKRIKVIFLTLICSLLFLLPTNTTGLEVGDMFICDFDDVASGLDSGSSGEIEWTNVGSANTFETKNANYVSSPNSLYYRGRSTVEKGYINLTEDYDYINSINFSVYLAPAGGDRNRLILDFYNNDTVELRFNFIVYDGGNELIQFYKNGVGYTTFLNSDLGTTASNLRKYFVIEHNGTNQFNVKLLNSTFGVQYNYDGAGYGSTNWSTFTHIYCYTTGTDTGTGGFYFDDFIINTNEPTDTSLPEVTGSTCTNCCQDILIGTTRSYTVTIDGDSGALAYFRIYDNNGAQRFLKPCPVGQTTFDVYFPYSWGLGNYTVVIFDQILLFNTGSYYNASCEFKVYSNSIYANYTDFYGGFFAEFYTDGTPCYYNVGDDPTVVYLLDNTSLDLTQDPPQKYGIYIYKVSETNYANWLYGYEVGQSGLDVLNSITFTYGQVFNEATSYIIRVFNLTFSGFVWTLDSLVYESETIIVCDEDISHLNTYSIDVVPYYDTYKYDETVTVTFTKLGTDEGAYRIITPSGETAYSGLMTTDQTTFNINVTFEDFADLPNKADVIGTWTIQIVDRYGSPSDINALTEYLTIDDITVTPLFPKLNDTLGGIVGLIVTMFLTLSPLIVAGALNNQMGSNIQIPPLVYGITGALGVTISTIFGWFPSWSIFFIIGVGILIVVILYFIGERGGS